MARRGYEELEHTADWALRIEGRDLEELMLHAAQGMLELAGVRAGGPGPAIQTLELSSNDPETLLVDWLNEVLLALELRRVAFTDIELELAGPHRLRARFREAPVEEIGKPIKAVTFHGLRVDRTPEGVAATVVFDV
jgi:SHS2 domain-containing protein